MWNYEIGYREKISKYIEDLVKNDGYPLEKYSVTTKDGYINTLYRIPHGKSEANTKKPRPAVILSHGLVCSCAIFLDQNLLAYYLVDNGFDVWLPNNRGTTFSTKHKDYDAEVEKEKYWNFSFHEIALYDLTAFIDFVLDQTGQKQICHIGVSQGVTVFAIMTSELPEYNEKINLSVFLGSPIVFDNVCRFPVRLHGYISPAVTMVAQKIFGLKVYEVPFVKELRYLMYYAKKNTLLRKIIGIFSNFVVGHKDNGQLADLDYPKVSLTAPNSSSMKQFLHFAQLLRSARFAKYDYGIDENLKLYGTKKPPLYDLSKVTAPVAIFYGKNDMYNNSEKDEIEKQLGNVVHLETLEYESYNHLDFIYAKDNVHLLYKHILELMKEYCSTTATSEEQ